MSHRRDHYESEDSPSEEEDEEESEYSDENEPESEFEDEYGSEERECQIDTDPIMPQLTVPCLKQNMPNGKKCYRNECLDVIDLISTSDTSSTFGNIVRVRDNHNHTYVVKWNRYRNNINEFKYEVRIQKAAFTIGVAPEIFQVYEQKYKTAGYIYIFMADLIRAGYESIAKLYGVYNSKHVQTGFKKLKKGELGDIPEATIEKIAEAVKKLHTIRVAHGDIHTGNVFYNPITKKVLLIDFGLSEMYATSEDAWKYEEYYGSKKYVNSHLVPNNWKRIRELSR